MSRAAACPAAVAAAAVAALAACRGVDHDAARQAFTRVPIATEHGLSGLSSDDDGAIWAVAERALAAYRITLDAELVPTVVRIGIVGVPAGVDLEAIAALGDGRFAFGTEGRGEPSATVLLAGRRDGALVIDGAIELPESRLGVTLQANHGAEGVCGRSDTIVTAIEATGRDAAGRFAPLVKTVRGEIVAVHRIRLATATGKISGLDCRIADDGSIYGWAIERHFEVTRLVRFTLPPMLRGSADITPTLGIDLGPILRSKLNLEGIAETTDGRVIAVVDNQWKTITGPSELLVMRPEALR